MGVGLSLWQLPERRRGPDDGGSRGARLRENWGQSVIWSEWLARRDGGNCAVDSTGTMTTEAVERG
jgi:hypothetical protein